MPPAGTSTRSPLSGRDYIRDALLGTPDGSNAGQCPAYAAEQIDVIPARAAGRGQDTPDVETVLDHVVAPSCTASSSARTISTPSTPTVW